MQDLFKKKYYDLLLKKSTAVNFGNYELFLDLVDEGERFTLLSVFYEGSPGFTRSILSLIEDFEDKGVLVDSERGQVLLARKHGFSSLCPQGFSLRLSQFVSEMQKYKKEIDEFKDKEFAFTKK